MRTPRRSRSLRQSSVAKHACNTSRRVKRRVRSNIYSAPSCIIKKKKITSLRLRYEYMTDQLLVVWHVPLIVQSSIAPLFSPSICPYVA
jgi:hypothetical protein